MGSKGQNSPFSEYGKVAFQIKWHHECSNMVANHLTTDPPHDGIKRSKFNYFRTWSCCISNYMESGMQPYKSTYSVLTHTLYHWAGVKGAKTFYLKAVMLHIKLKGKEHRAPCKHTFCPYTSPQPVGLIKGTETLNVVMLHIKLRRKKYRLA